VIERILSGGQTGVDRAALDVALELGVPCGGWCPRGRKAEDGRLPAHYPLRETPSAKYAQRTVWNIRDADGTLILTTGPLTGGTALTHSLATNMHKPCLVVELGDAYHDKQAVTDWLAAQAIRVLNVAGPRESQQPGISGRAAAFLRTLLQPRQ
jgi:hypothetical protein